MKPDRFLAANGYLETWLADYGIEDESNLILTGADAGSGISFTTCETGIVIRLMDGIGGDQPIVEIGYPQAAKLAKFLCAVFPHVEDE